MGHASVGVQVVTTPATNPHPARLLVGSRVARLQLSSASSGVASVTIADSAARVVRRWTAPVSRGVNTLIWDLQVERQAGRLADAPAGWFTVEVRVGELRATGEVQVLEDPILMRARGDAPRQ